MIPNRYLPGVQQSSQEKACLYLDILKSTVHLHSYRHHCSLFHLTHTVIIVMIQSLRKPNLLSKIVQKKTVTIAKDRCRLGRYAHFHMALSTGMSSTTWVLKVIQSDLFINCIIEVFHWVFVSKWMVLFHDSQPPVVFGSDCSSLRRFCNVYHVLVRWIKSFLMFTTLL